MNNIILLSKTIINTLIFLILIYAWHTSTRLKSGEHEMLANRCISDISELNGRHDHSIERVYASRFFWDKEITLIARTLSTNTLDNLFCKYKSGKLIEVIINKKRVQL